MTDTDDLRDKPDAHRRKQVCEWLRSIGIDPNRVPLEDPLTVTAINEGALKVTWNEFDVETWRRTHPDDLPVIHHTTITDIAPPGFHAVRWEAWEYMTGLYA